MYVNAKGPSNGGALCVFLVRVVFIKRTIKSLF